MICWNVVAIRSSWQPLSVCPRNCIPLTVINLAGRVAEPLHDTRGRNCVWRRRSPSERSSRRRYREEETEDKKGQVQVGNGTGVVESPVLLGTRVSCSLVKWARARNEGLH